MWRNCLLIKTIALRYHLATILCTIDFKTTNNCLIFISDCNFYLSEIRHQKNFSPQPIKVNFDFKHVILKGAKLTEPALVLKNIFFSIASNDRRRLFDPIEKIGYIWLLNRISLTCFC